jgi:hypothetical protein
MEHDNPFNPFLVSVTLEQLRGLVSSFEDFADDARMVLCLTTSGADPDHANLGLELIVSGGCSAQEHSMTIHNLPLSND